MKDNRYFSMLDEIITTEPSFGITLARMNIVESDNQPTMATDGKTVFINGAWIENCSRGDLRFVMMHECCHVKLKHNTQMRRMIQDGLELDLERLNTAMDYEVNHFMNRHGGTVPLGRPFDVSKYPDDDPLWEDIYFQPQPESEKVKNEENRGGKTGPESGPESDTSPQGKEGTEESTEGSPGEKSGGSDGSDRSDGSDTSNKDAVSWSDQLVAGDGAVLPSPGKNMDAEESEIESENIIQANRYKGAAGISGSFAREKLAEITEDEPMWYEIMEEFVNEFSPDDFSIANPDLIFLQQGIIVSDLDGETLERVVILMDVSGSTHYEIPRFFNSVNNIFSKYENAQVDIVYWSTKLHRHDELTSDDFPIKFDRDIGTGGTEFNSAMKYVKDNINDCCAVIVFTDLYFQGITKENRPDFPVLWVDFSPYQIHRGKWKHDFGTYVAMTEDD